MMYREIPATDLRVSAICLGTVPFGTDVATESAFDLMDQYLSYGGNFIDTAHIYADWLPGEKGRSEKTIGQWLAARGNRQQVVLATKGAHPTFEAMQMPRLSRAEIVADLEESLTHLQTDYIDLYWLHRDDVTRPVADILDTLNDQVRAGKIRYFGCSNWTPARISEAMHYAHDHQVQGFVANQMMWSVATLNADAIEDKTLVAMDESGFALHTASQLTAVPYSSQANGFFTKLSYTGVEGLSPTLQRLYVNQANTEKLRILQKAAEELGQSVSQVVVSYLLSQPFLTIPCVGCFTAGQLVETMSAADLRLSDEWVQSLTEVS